MLYIHHLEHTGEVWNQFGPNGTPGGRVHDLEKTSPNRRKMTKNAKSNFWLPELIPGPNWLQTSPACTPGCMQSI